MIQTKKINYLFINWLTLTLIFVFIMIIVGGLTRLTNSGLSITEWELFEGILPPLNEQNGIIILIYIKKLLNTNYEF